MKNIYYYLLITSLFVYVFMRGKKIAGEIHASLDVLTILKLGFESTMMELFPQKETTAATKSGQSQVLNNVDQAPFSFTADENEFADEFNVRRRKAKALAKKNYELRSERSNFRFQKNHLN